MFQYDVFLLYIFPCSVVRNHTFELAQITIRHQFWCINKHFHFDNRKYIFVFCILSKKSKPKVLFSGDYTNFLKKISLEILKRRFLKVKYLSIPPCYHFVTIREILWYHINFFWTTFMIKKNVIIWSLTSRLNLTRFKLKLKKKYLLWW